MIGGNRNHLTMEVFSMPKRFSEHAVDKINGILSTHKNHVGSQLKKQNPSIYRDYVASDGITMAIIC